jgi:hypothetical protein
MKLKRIGFFRELRHGLSTGPSLRDSIRNGKQSSDAARIAAYLQKGTVFIACPGVVKDVLKKEGGPVIGSPHIRTDGVWAWPSDLAYYVTHYNVALPREFVEHIEGNGWQPPPAESIQLANLELED